MSVEDLHKVYQDAFKAYMGLIQALPVWRNADQQRRLDDARRACEDAKWRYETAKFWNSLEHNDAA